MYTAETASVLMFMGYDSITDFNCTYVDSTSVTLEWFHADQKPTEQDVLDNELAWAKSEAKKRVKLVGAGKISQVYPFIGGNTTEAVGLYNFALDLYTSMIPAARETLSGNLLTLKNIYDAATTAIAVINTMTDATLVVAYDATNTPGWP